MAVINSVGVGRGEKSVGEFTYRRARGGRTIAARRIIENKSNTPAQATQRNDFAKSASVIKFIPKRFMELMSVKSKTGSARNNFLSVNYDAAVKWWWNENSIGYGTVGGAITRIVATSTNDIPFTPVVGDLQPTKNEYDSTTGFTLATRLREGIERVSLSLIAACSSGWVNLNTFDLSPSSSSSGSPSTPENPDTPQTLAEDEKVRKDLLRSSVQPATGVTVDINGGEISVLVNTTRYLNSLNYSFPVGSRYALLPSLKVNNRLVSVYSAPWFEKES